MRLDPQFAKYLIFAGSLAVLAAGLAREAFVLNVGVDTILQDNGIADIDFLLPHCDANSVSFPLPPMTFATALFHLRRMINCPWRSSVNPMLGLDLNFTLHSLKATLLSWGPQLSNFTHPEQRLHTF